ncbi:hypothetical protein JCM16814_09320 [Desulfobaculum senezii]
MTDNAPSTPQGATAEELLENAPEALHPVLQAIVDNIRFILAGIAVLILAVGGTAIYKHVQEGKRAEAEAQLASIIAQPAAERVEALVNFESTAPEGMHTGIRLELAGALSESGQHERAAEELGKIAKAGNGLSTVAAIAQANELTKLDRTEDAIAILDGAKATAPESFVSIILREKASLSESIGDLKSALAAYEELLAEASPRNKGFIEGKVAELKAALSTNS